MVKNLPANAVDVSLIPELQRYRGERNGNPLQYSCLGNPMDRGACGAAVHGGHKDLDMTKWLNNNQEHTHTGSSTTVWFMLGDRNMYYGRTKKVHVTEARGTRKCFWDDTWMCLERYVGLEDEELRMFWHRGIEKNIYKMKDIGKKHGTFGELWMNPFVNVNMRICWEENLWIWSLIIIQKAVESEEGSDGMCFRKFILRKVWIRRWRKARLETWKSTGERSWTKAVTAGQKIKGGRASGDIEEIEYTVTN